MGRDPRWYEEGEEPDYRVTLANERTFLAWLRTALALLAGAVALDQLVPAFGVPGAGTWLAVLLALTATLLAAFGYRRWAAVQRAMRHRAPLPMSWLPFVIGWVTALLGVIVLALVITA